MVQFSLQLARIGVYWAASTFPAHSAAPLAAMCAAAAASVPVARPVLLRLSRDRFRLWLDIVLALIATVLIAGALRAGFGSEALP